MTNHDPDALAAELFRTFARFEYALKAAAFHKGDGAAEADWRGFAESVAVIFDGPENEEFVQAIDYILAHPPMKQIVEAGVLGWSPSPPQTNLRSDRVLIYVRRVRNNLFHGGKFNGRWFEPQRSAALLQHSLTILNACLSASPPVSEAYYNEP